MALPIASQTPVLTLSEAMEMIEPQTLALLCSLTSSFFSLAKSLLGPQMVASPKLKELGGRI